MASDGEGEQSRALVLELAPALEHRARRRRVHGCASPSTKCGRLDEIDVNFMPA
jgi:hypothetical protein